MIVPTAAWSVGQAEGLDDPGMCGINGIFAYHYAANPIDLDELLRTRDRMTSRGPDGCGHWLAPDRRVAFAHRRLSIIDLSAAAGQPMASADGRLVITFNGEIYNHAALRRELQAKGRVFRTRSDTEVLLHLYADRGEEMVRALRGMFAIAIWDSARRSLLLARDPYAIKPLYYADDGWTIRFASSVKALVAGGAVRRDVDPAGIVGFHIFGSVPEPFTTMAAIRALPAGSTMRVDRAGPRRPRVYHRIGDAFRYATGESHTSQALIDAVRSSVRAHLVADVEVGSFLSAGVDSGALVGLMRDAGASQIKTVTLAFEEFRGGDRDEAHLASTVARQYDTDHQTRVVTRTEFESDLERILDAMDQPTIDGINTWFVAKAAREQGLKVAVSGIGGDELLGGYPSFRDIPRWVRWMRVPSALPLLGRTARGMGPLLARVSRVHPKTAGMLELGGSYAGAYLLKRGLLLPWELSRRMASDVVEAGLRRFDPVQHIEDILRPLPRCAFARVATLEAELYLRNQLLRDADWAGMAHSVEVRVPLVDSVLLAETARHMPLLAAGKGKRTLAAAPSLPLPEAVIDRPKTGFSTPLADWLAARDGPGPESGGALAAPWARRWSRLVADHCAQAA